MTTAYRGTGGSAGRRPPDRRPENSSTSELRELGQVTSELLHDLGGILSVLSGRVSLAREEASLGRIPAEELQRIQGDTDELRRMVVDILEELRNRPRSLEVTFPVCSTIDETIHRWLVGAPSVNTTLRSTLSPQAEIAGPRSFFTRAIGNLLRNAARHARGEIRITIRPEDDGHAAQIRVEDDGAGVAPEVRERLFDPFVTGAASGTGLGLSFARWGIARLGGSLELAPEATDLGGAAFIVKVPLRRLPAPPAPEGRPEKASRTSPTESLAGIKVVVVDDDRAVRATLTRLLNRSGAEAVAIDPSPWRHASDATSELRAADPDVIILDVNLDRVSGAGVARALEDDAPHLYPRLLFVTGGIPPRELDRHTVISKMAGWDELVSQIHAIRAHSA